jgi:hypothetical protein
MGIRSLSAASISTGAKRSKFWDQSAVVVTSSYDSIATTTVGAGGVSSITFSSIPTTYTHLQLRCFVQASNASPTFETGKITINGNNLTKNHYLYGDGSNVYSGIGATNNVINVPSAGHANIFAAAVIDILDYKNTNKNKTVRTLGVTDTNGGGELVLYSNLYNTNTDAITSLTFSITGLNITQYSSLALYGIKGS